jgi:serine/threonine protein kinase
MNDRNYNELAYDLYGEWEERRANGESISLEQICESYPEIYPEVLSIAQKIRELGLSPVPPTAHTDTLHSNNKDTLVSMNLPSIQRDGWKEIGRGASSVVFRGYDPDFRTTVAYKVLQPNQIISPSEFVHLLKRFEQEAHILARLKHEGIVRIFKTFSDSGRPILEMEFLPGGSLSDYASILRNKGVLAIAQFMERVARAVGFAHQNEIIHRDLKPNNILLDQSGLPCVSDFGIAKLVQTDRLQPSNTTFDEGKIQDRVDGQKTTLTHPNRQPGTRAYMAPEQFDPSFGEITPATDVWAMGVILFELLYKSRPFQGENWSESKESVCEKLLDLPPTRQGRLGRRLTEIIRRCLARDPSVRYASGIELADALLNINRSRFPKFIGFPLLFVAIVIGALPFLNVGGSPQTNLQKQEIRSLEPEWINPEVELQNRKQLEQGKNICLVGKGAQVAYRSVGNSIVQNADHTMTITTEEQCVFIEFLASLPPKGKYRIRGTLRHDDAGSHGSTIGLFAGGSGSWSDQEWAYICGAFTHAALGSREGLSQSTIFRAHKRLGESMFLDTHNFSHKRIREIKPPQTREFDLEIDAETMATRGLSVPPIPFNKFDQIGKDFSNSRPLVSTTEPEIRMGGAIGVFVQAGRVTIQSLTVEPIILDRDQD